MTERRLHTSAGLSIAACTAHDGACDGRARPKWRAGSWHLLPKGLPSWAPSAHHWSALGLLCGL